MKYILNDDLKSKTGHMEKNPHVNLMNTQSGQSVMPAKVNEATTLVLM